MILVTGGAGFVGSNLVRRLLLDQTIERVHIVDNLLSAERINIPDHPKVIFTEGSIADDKIVNNLQDEYAYVYHLATYHGNQSSIHDPLADHENNTLTTLKLFDKLKNFKNLKKIVYSGAGCAVAKKTDSDPEATPESDHVCLDMDSPYSISKIIGEFYACYYGKQHRLPIVRARFQNVYGPGEILGAGQWRGTPATIWRNVVPTFMYKALCQEALPLENDGSATRDFIFVDDIVKGLIACAYKGTPGEVYNLATGREIAIKELADQINVMTGNPTPVSHLPRRSWDNSGRRYGCPNKAEKELGFLAETSLEKGLFRTLEWTKNHRDVIETAIAKHAHQLSS